MANNNELLVSGARSALERLKLETAAELGIQNYAGIDKGNLASSVNGYVGGYMTRKLVALGERTLAERSKV